MASDFIVNMVEAVEVYDEAGELDGYALVAAPYWYSPEKSSEEAYERLVAARITPLTPVRATRSTAWADVNDLRYGGGEGLRYRPVTLP